MSFILPLFQGSAEALEQEKSLVFCKEQTCALEESPGWSEVLEKPLPKQGELWMQQEGAACGAGGEPCFGVGESHVTLWFLTKSPHRNIGALRGDCTSG